MLAIAAQSGLVRDATGIARRADVLRQHLLQIGATFEAARRGGRCACHDAFRPRKAAAGPTHAGRDSAAQPRIRPAASLARRRFLRLRQILGSTHMKARDWTDTTAHRAHLQALANRAAGHPHAEPVSEVVVPCTERLLSPMSGEWAARRTFERLLECRYSAAQRP